MRATGHRYVVLHRRAERALGRAISSRSSQNCSAWASLAAIVASSTRPASNADSSSVRARSGSAAAWARVGGEFDQRVPRVLAGERRTRARDMGRAPPRGCAAA
jgi:hypothetical protein